MTAGDENTLMLASDKIPGGVRGTNPSSRLASTAGAA